MAEPTAERMDGFRGGSTARTANGAGDALARSFGGQLRERNSTQDTPNADLPTETPRRLTPFATVELWVTEMLEVQRLGRSPGNGWRPCTFKTASR